MIALIIGQGCAGQTKAAKTALVVGGIVGIAAGAAFNAHISQGEDTDGDGVDEFPDGALVCALGGCLIGALISVTGLGLALYGIVVPTAESAPAVPLPSPPPPEAPPMSVIAGPGFYRPLPEVAADSATLRLAQQVRALVLTGKCEAARATLLQIKTRNAEYFRQLATGPVFRGC